MLFNTNKFLENSKRVHLNTGEISAIDTIPNNKAWERLKEFWDMDIRYSESDKSSNMFPLGGNGAHQVYRIRSGDLSRFARVARFPP
ncbi:MAG: hypothetical protein LBU35_01680 [Holosporales bacterium]|jgi:hypothetical protein|nr:hypothetical protein [Holosporales bacterium]